MSRLILLACVLLSATGCLSSTGSLRGRLGNLDLRVVDASGTCREGVCEASLRWRWHGERSVADQDVAIELRLHFVDRIGRVDVDGEALVVDSRSFRFLRECSVVGWLEFSRTARGELSVSQILVDMPALRARLEFHGEAVAMIGEMAKPYAGWLRALNAKCAEAGLGSLTE